MHLGHILLLTVFFVLFSWLFIRDTQHIRETDGMILFLNLEMIAIQTTSNIHR